MNLNALKKYYTSSPKFIKKLYSYIPWSWRMGKSYRDTFSFLELSKDWNEKKWQTYQSTQVRELMKHCEKYIPYYISLFKEMDIDTNAKDIWNEFYKIPIIDKETVTTNLDKFRSIDLASKFYSATTGGTTGKPMQIYYDTDSYQKEWAYKIFFWNLSINYTPDSKKATFRGVSFDSTLYIENPIYNEIRFSPFQLDDNIDKIVNKLIDYNPKYIHGYPSAIEQLAKYLIINKIILKNIKGVILISENIFSHQKDIINQAFGCFPYSFYGHSERLIFASMDKSCDVYYAHPAYGFTEIIGNDGKSIHKIEKLGELVGTGFINKGMPLLRFKTGDFSEWGTSQKSSLHMPQLKFIKGRWQQEYLIGKEGKKVSLTALNMHSDVYAKVKQMQYKQDEKGIVILNIVKDTEYSLDDEIYIRNEHMGKLGEQYTLLFSYVPSLDKTIAGKTKYLIQDIAE